jgi:CRISPR-associated protein Cas1
MIFGDHTVKVVKKTYYIETPASLSVALNQLMIDQGNDVRDTRPLEDAGHIIIDNPQVTLTIPLLQACIENHVAVVVCTEKHLPGGIFLPFEGHSMAGGRARAQISSSKPLIKQLWQAIVVSKIRNQAAVLRNHGRPFQKLERYALAVRSGDITNVEAAAAAYYWRQWDGNDSDFRRDPYGGPPNHLLNFSYAVLRSMAARYLVGSGLWPLVGIFHRNAYNNLPLADDIMEPYRAFADNLVLQLMQSHPDLREQFFLERPEKQALLKIHFLDVIMANERRPLQLAMQLTCASLARCFEDKTAEHLIFPTLDE